MPTAAELTKVIRDLERVLEEQIARNGPLEQVLGARDQEIRDLKTAAKARGEGISVQAASQISYLKSEVGQLKELLLLATKLIKSQERIIDLERGDYR